ncbi:MAG: phosphoribosylformylglycinamidine cyclo-ligase [Gammaproteobacteria bacterium]|nr:MAG: phosphoribosylformylglycinamidine cyclo-ligase [Gammaproteobacteria bacterium]
MSITYKDSGVDKEEGYRLVEKAKAAAKSTHSNRVLGDIGSFAALFDIGGYNNPVLVSGTDGVGTKLDVAFKQNRYDTVGIDCVAMCVNDVLCHGAQPLFFLDYIGCGKLDAAQAADLVTGIANGCRQAGCSLVGGETAEMPGFYKVGDYDIAGFCVGVVEKNDIINGDNVSVGDTIIGLASSGVHSNGFSLVRRLFPDLLEVVDGKPVGEILLTPTKIYVKPVQTVLKQFPGAVKGMAHITGGGLIENLPRTLPKGICGQIDAQAIRDNVACQAIFKAIEDKGVARQEMWGTFNMGVGFCLVVDSAQADDIVKVLNETGETAFILGQTVADDRREIIINDN